MRTTDMSMRRRPCYLNSSAACVRTERGHSARQVTFAPDVLPWTWKGSNPVTLTPIKKCVIWDSTPTCCGCQVSNPTSCILRPFAGTYRAKQRRMAGRNVKTPKELAEGPKPDRQPPQAHS